jgi:hypothetical protein
MPFLLTCHASLLGSTERDLLHTHTMHANSYAPQASIGNPIFKYHAGENCSERRRTALSPCGRRQQEIQHAGPPRSTTTLPEKWPTNGPPNTKPLKLGHAPRRRREYRTNHHEWVVLRYSLQGGHAHCTPIEALVQQFPAVHHSPSTPERNAVPLYHGVFDVHRSAACRRRWSFSSLSAATRLQLRRNNSMPSNPGASART